MRYSHRFVVAAALALVACSDSKKDTRSVEDAGSDASTAVEPDVDSATVEPDDDAGADTPDDAATSSRLPRATLERPPTTGLPASLRPPR